MAQRPTMNCCRHATCSCAPSATMPIGTVFLAESMPRIFAPIPGAISFAPRPSPTGRFPARSSRVSNFWTTTPTARTSCSLPLLKPGDGGTIAALDFRPAAATLVNSILRRPEAYHTRLREAAGKPATGAVASIHEQTRVKEPGLERFLRYDRWPRHAFRVLIFDPARTHADYETLELREDPGFAGGAFTV